MYVARNGKLQGMIALENTIRPGRAEMLPEEKAVYVESLVSKGCPVLRLFMGTLREKPGGGRILSVKESPPEVLAMCNRRIAGGEKLPFAEESVSASMPKTRRFNKGKFFQRLAAYGHFGRSDMELPWERIDEGALSSI
jgi:hypothetical protein